MAAAAGVVVGVGLAVVLWLLTVKHRVTVTAVWHLDLVIGAAAGVLTCVGLGHGRELLARSFLLDRPSAAVLVTVAVSAQVIVIAVNAILAVTTRGAGRPSLQVRPMDYTRGFRPESLPIVAPVAALVEESVFRGALLPLGTLALAPAVGLATASGVSLVLSAVGFGAAHMNRTLMGRVGAALSGAVYGGAVLLTHSLAAAVGAHVFGNLIGGLCAWYLHRHVPEASRM